jgi:hypothetical protein
MRKTTKVLLGVLIVVIGFAILSNIALNRVNDYKYTFKIYVEGYGNYWTNEQPTTVEDGVAFLDRDGKLKIFQGYPFKIEAWLPVGGTQ